VRTIPELIDLLERGPKLMYDARQALHTAKTACATAKEAVAEREADAIAAVSLDHDDKGKARYSNKEAREQAAHKLLSGDPEYARVSQQFSRAEVDVQNAQIRLNLLEDETKLYHAQLDAAVAVLRSEAVQELTKATLALARYEAIKETPS